MPKLQFSFNFYYLLATFLLFATELAIALFINSGFIRFYMSDILVVILIYCGIKSFVKTSRLLPLYVFLFAVIIEIAQWLNLPQLMGIKTGTALAIAVGSSFDWWDILCYAAGCTILLLWQESKQNLAIIIIETITMFGLFLVVQPLLPDSMSIFAILYGYLPLSYT